MDVLGRIVRPFFIPRIGDKTMATKRSKKLAVTIMGGPTIGSLLGDDAKPRKARKASGEAPAETPEATEPTNPTADATTATAE